MILLTPLDLSLAALLIVLLAFLCMHMKLELSRQILVAGLRTTIQLLIIGYVLKALFSEVHPAWMGLIAIIMLTAAAREVTARQKRRFTGWRGFGIGGVSMFVSSFSITILALTVIIKARPWYAPQYAVPLLGMLLGNTMSGIALGLDRLTQSAWEQRTVIEGRLMMGQTWQDAIGHIVRDSTKSGMIPILNAMSAAGLVSLPGMMTGQILAGSPPIEAVKYQILIMFLITGGTGFGTLLAVRLGAAGLFDERERLCMKRLSMKN